ncbi:MerR family transcriptional regulator [Peribacillus sp. TH16]|nr:MerR family transcriptional regulator [Peribacillus sp. TH16]
MKGFIYNIDPSSKRGEKRIGNSQPFGYFSKDAALELEITTSILRRWSIELEKLGYTFDRNEKEQRIYQERDFKALRELKKLLANNISFVDAIKAVVSMGLEGKTPLSRLAFSQMKSVYRSVN